MREDRFDLILLDVNMPGMGGIEACRALRSGSDAAILMLTIRNIERDKVGALDVKVIHITRTIVEEDF